MLLKSEDLEGGFLPRARHQWHSPESMTNQINTTLRLGDIDVDVGWLLTAEMLTNGHPSPTTSPSPNSRKFWVRELIKLTYWSIDTIIDADSEQSVEFYNFPFGFEH